MYLLFLVSAVLINFVVANELNHTKHGIETKRDEPAIDNKNTMGVPLWKQHFWKPHKLKKSHNSSLFDRAENMIRLPTISHTEDKKKKFVKKSPKRTIQKIIKKNRQKTKRIYVVKLQSKTTKSPEPRDKGIEDMSAWKDEQTTLPPNQNKKPKKYKPKVARFPKPFQKLQKKKFHKRDKRNALEKDDVYILKDLDEMTFLKNDEDFSVVKTHVKRYW